MNISTIRQNIILNQDARQNAKIDYTQFDILFGTQCAVVAGLTFVSMCWAIIPGFAPALHASSARHI